MIADGRYAYPENGISFTLHFVGVDYDIAECRIEPSQGEYPLTGNFDMAANVTILKNYGESLFFPVVPLEMVNTDA